MNEKPDTTDFVIVHSTGFGTRTAAHPHSRNARRGRGRAEHPGRHGGLLLLLGLCTSAFMLLFILQAVRTEYAPDALAVMRNVLNNTDVTEGEDSDGDGSADTLGKLQLVRLPSILEVFAPSDSPVPPLSMENAVVDDESLTAKIYAPAGTAAASVLEGTVKSVDMGGQLGGCVVISHKGDIDVYYYGLDKITVERGQPVRQNSPIGTLAGDSLYLRVTVEGRPVDPFEFLGVKAEIGG